VERPLPLPAEIVSMKSHMGTPKKYLTSTPGGRRPQVWPGSSVRRGCLFRHLQVLSCVRSLGRAVSPWGLPRSGACRSWVLLVVVALLGCSKRPAEEPHVPESGSSGQQVDSPGRGPVPPREDWGLHTYEKVILLRQSLVLHLPEGDKWVPLPGRGTWSGLRHDPTDSEVWVRHSSARRTVTVDECEREARLGWPEIREPDPDAITRLLRAPRDYGGRVSIVLNKEGGGRVEAFSVGLSRCLAVVFLTGNGPGFPERLRSFASEVIETMRVPGLGERGLEKRAEPLR